MANKKKDISEMLGIIPSLHTPFNEKNEIDIVFHAAAFKHVSLVQSNILSSINNKLCFFDIFFSGFLILITLLF